MLNKTNTTWPQKPLTEVVDLNPRLDKSAYRDDLDVSFVPMVAVEAGSGRMEVTQTKRLGTVKKGHTTFKEDDVLFAKITPCMENGKMAVVPKLTNGLRFGSAEFHVLRPHEGIDARFVDYFVSSQGFRREAAHHMTGAVGQKRVPQFFLEEASIPVPLLEDQRRIVAEIEKQFSRLDEAVASLKRTKANLKRYKAAVLKAAVEGKLTEDWRKQHPDVEPASKLLERILGERRAKWKGGHKTPAGPEVSGLPSLPSGWVWTNLGQIFEVCVGATPSRGKPEYWNGTIPWVSSGEVAFCRIRQTREHITEKGLTNSSTELHPSGTVLLGMIGEGKTRGQAAILDIEACNNQNSAAIRVSMAGIPPEYVYRYLEGQYAANRAIGSGNNQPALNKARVQAIPLPLPSLVEQTQIVAEVERRLSVIDELEATVEANLTRADRLRQSILSQAFSGKLVFDTLQERSA